MFLQFMNNMLNFFPEKVSLFVSEHLSLLLPEFQHEVQIAGGLLRSCTTFTGCLLLHRLLIVGKESEVLKRKDELSPSLLSHTCNLKNSYDSYKTVSIEK